MYFSIPGYKLEVELFLDNFEIFKLLNNSLDFLYNFHLKNFKIFNKVIYLKNGGEYIFKHLKELSYLKYGYNNFFEMNNSYISVSSYFENNQKTTFSIDDSFLGSIVGKNILLIGDIYDTGNTIFNVKNYLLLKGAKSVYPYCFLVRKSDRLKSFPIFYSSVKINFPNFLIGFGLDFNNYFRELGSIYIIKQIEKEG